MFSYSYSWTLESILHTPSYAYLKTNLFTPFQARVVVSSVGDYIILKKKKSSLPLLSSPLEDYTLSPLDVERDHAIYFNQQDISHMIAKFLPMVCCQLALLCFCHHHEENFLSHWPLDRCSGIIHMKQSLLADHETCSL